MTTPLFQRTVLQEAFAALRTDLVREDGPSISTMRNYRFAIVPYAVTPHPRARPAPDPRARRRSQHRHPPHHRRTRAPTGRAREGEQVMSTTATPADVLEGRARWCVVEGDNAEVLPTLPAKSVSHVITDPPYSAVTHAAAAAAAAAARPLPDGSIRRVYNSGANGFGFDCLADGQREAMALEFARASARWVLIFSDQEGAHGWMVANVAAGLDHVRIGQWVKEGAAPQFTGDRPANGCEACIVSHAKDRKRWNGGGLPALWRHPIRALEAKRTGDGRDEHITPKPIGLMLELLEQFTDADEIVLDPFAGSGTTGVACLRLGRRFIGVEKDAKYAAVARERLSAESQGLTLRDARAGQQSLFGAIDGTAKS